MKFFRSEYVRVFPCAYRGTSEANQINAATVINAEARLNTEYNLTHLGGMYIPGFVNDVPGKRAKNCFIASYTVGTELDCVLGGYHFNLKLYDLDLDSTNPYLIIKLNDYNLPDDSTTETLASLDSGFVDLYLDKDIGGITRFTGLGIATESEYEASNCDYYLKVFDEHNEIISDNILPEEFLTTLESTTQGIIDVLDKSGQPMSSTPLAELTTTGNPRFNSIIVGSDDAKIDYLSAYGLRLDGKSHGLFETTENRIFVNSMQNAGQANSKEQTLILREDFAELYTVDADGPTQSITLDNDDNEIKISTDVGKIELSAKCSNTGAIDKYNKVEITPNQITGVRVTGTLNVVGNTAGMETTIYTDGTPILPVSASTLTPTAGDLTTIKIGNQIYSIPSGGGSSTIVQGNPTTIPAGTLETLETLRINNDYYTIPSGGGGGGGIDNLYPYSGQVKFIKTGSTSSPGFEATGYTKFSHTNSSNNADVTIEGILETNYGNFKTITITSKLDIIGSANISSATIPTINGGTITANTIKAETLSIKSISSNDGQMSISAKTISTDNLTVNSLLTAKALNIRNKSEFNGQALFNYATSTNVSTNPDAKFAGRVLFSKESNTPTDFTVQCNGAISTRYMYSRTGYQGSDKRLKENIQPYTPTASILDLPIHKFDFIDGPKNQIGCIAQELQEICPEIVDEGPDGMLAIQETKLVYLLLDEVKKLRKEVDELKNK